MKCYYCYHCKLYFQLQETVRTLEKQQCELEEEVSYTVIVQHMHEHSSCFCIQKAGHALKEQQQIIQEKEEEVG